MEVYVEDYAKVKTTINIDKSANYQSSYWLTVIKFSLATPPKKKGFFDKIGRIRLKHEHSEEVYMEFVDFDLYEMRVFLPAGTPPEHEFDLLIEICDNDQFKITCTHFLVRVMTIHVNLYNCLLNLTSRMLFWCSYKQYLLNVLKTSFTIELQPSKKQLKVSYISDYIITLILSP